MRQTSATGSVRFSTPRGASLACLLGLALAALAAPPALAAQPLKIREAFPGSTTADPAAEFLELQMTAEGQSDIDGQVLRFYDSTGAETSTYTVPADAGVGESQRTVLFATQEAITEGVVVSPDFNLGGGANRIDPAGGAACFTGVSPADCLTWGSIPIFTPLDSFPDRQSANAPAIADGSSLTRTIAGGCSTYLDAPDDTANSSADFALTAPTPRNNATAPTEIRCPPETIILTFPPNPTNSASATFTFAEFPGEPAVTFECELDGDGSFSGPETQSCDSGTIAYDLLPDGQHTFRVRATGENPTPGPPDTHTWTVDTAAPQTTILSTPPEPSDGVSASFTYSSSEPSSTFRCQLDDGAIQVCSAAGRTYFNLIDGPHSFRVWATDNAGNQDPSPATRDFTVNTALADFTPPDTSILLAPFNPSPKDSAFFAYASNESPSTFQCSLDKSPFAPCSELGVSYGSLRNGSHTFAVRAIDRAGNVDTVPAGYTWRIAAPLPETRIVKAPPGRIALRGSKRRARVTFRFVSSKPSSTFRCRLDRGRFRSCRPPLKLRVGTGRHRFEVYAIDDLGNEEATPARRIFRVLAPRRGGFFG